MTSSIQSNCEEIFAKTRQIEGMIKLLEYSDNIIFLHAYQSYTEMLSNETNKNKNLDFEANPVTHTYTRTLMMMICLSDTYISHSSHPIKRHTGAFRRRQRASSSAVATHLILDFLSWHASFYEKIRKLLGRRGVGTCIDRQSSYTLDKLLYRMTTPRASKRDSEASGQRERERGPSIFIGRDVPDKLLYRDTTSF